jgi:hypothetical protein
MAPTLEEFLDFARTLDGQTLWTQAQEHEFTVTVEEQALVIMPQTGQSRRVGTKELRRVLDHFADSRFDYSPGRYHDLSRNASYLLAILELFHAGAGATQTDEQHAKAKKQAIDKANAVLRAMKDIDGDTKQLAAGIGLEAWRRVTKDVSKTAPNRKTISAALAWALAFDEAYWSEIEKE